MQIARLALRLQPLAVPQAILALHPLHLAIGDPQAVEGGIAHHDGTFEDFPLDQCDVQAIQGNFVAAVEDADHDHGLRECLEYGFHLVPIERAVIVTTGRQLVVSAPRHGERSVPQTALTMTELEVEHIRAVLESTSWRVRGSGGAAERLGLKPTTLESRMARLGIARKKTG